jgi:hypothetical protein
MDGSFIPTGIEVAACMTFLKEKPSSVFILSEWNSICIAPLKMKATWTSETLVTYHIVSRRQNPKELDLNLVSSMKYETVLLSFLISEIVRCVAVDLVKLF